MASPCEIPAGVRGTLNSPVILNRAAVKNPVNRTASVTLRDPSLALRMTAGFWEPSRTPCREYHFRACFATARKAARLRKLRPALFRDACRGDPCGRPFLPASDRGQHTGDHKGRPYAAVSVSPQGRGWKNAVGSLFVKYSKRLPGGAMSVS